MAAAELLDVVDLQGNPTGGIANKYTVHRQGLWHRDTHAWLTDGVHLLQQKRTDERNPDGSYKKAIMPGAWDISVGGHVDAGESYVGATVREIKEELGLEVAPGQLIIVGMLAVEMTIPGWPEPHRTVGANFVVYDPELSLSALVLQLSEVTDARLYPIDQLEADLLDPATAERHAPQPVELWRLGIRGMREVIARNRPADGQF